MYLGEIRLNWRYLCAASVGLSVGYAINSYIASIFSPHLMKEFGWTKAQFAMLNAFVDARDWRAGYLAVAAITAMGGGAALFLLTGLERNRASTIKATPDSTLASYREIFRDPAFRIIASAILMCNLTHMLVGSQLKLILLDRAMSSTLASGMISLFAIGTMAGRLLSGFALDRFPSQVVAAIVLGSPGLGLLVPGSGLTSVPMIALAVLSIGVATGAELDIAAYLVMRFFPAGVYSTDYGMVAAAIAVSSASGSLFLGAVLSATGSFSGYLLISSVTTIAGAGLFLLLKPDGPRADAIPAKTGR